MHQFKYVSRIPVPPAEVFRWHLREGTLRRLIPPWKDIDVDLDEGVVEGGKTAFRIHLGGIALRWIAEHVEVSQGHLRFRDRQIKGPFGKWEHTHQVTGDNEHSSALEDDIQYSLPWWSFGLGLANRLVRKRLSRQFRYRHKTTLNDLVLHRKYAFDRPLRIVVSGSSGFIGSQLVNFLAAGGHEVFRLGHHEMPLSHNEIMWDVMQGSTDLERLEGMDAVVHIAGESVLSPRWSQQKKMDIIESRVRGTAHLAKALASLSEPPRTFLSASAIGFYGNRGTEILDETSTPGDDGFLSAICQDTEAASLYAEQAGIRTVQLRTGIVLSPFGGILNPLLVPFKLGLGGRYGGRHQYLSWIGLDDVLGAIYHLISDESIEGPVNLTSPNPVTMTEFARTLGRALSRPVMVNMPPWLVRVLLGEVADDAALMSVRAIPNRLQATGYEFLHPTLDGMLRHALGRK